MILKIQIILFLITISAISEVKTVYCTKHARDGSITRVCCPGYTGDGYNCFSVCPNGCPNGICVAPNICRCVKGFTKYRGPYSACEPIPTTPETSILKTTFETIQTTTSTPNCFDSCYNGTCVKNLCTCAEGWFLQQHGEVGYICASQSRNIRGITANNSACSEGFELQADKLVVCKRKLVVSGSSTTWTHLLHNQLILYLVLLINCYIFTLEVFIFI